MRFESVHTIAASVYSCGRSAVALLVIKSHKVVGLFTMVTETRFQKQLCCQDGIHHDGVWHQQARLVPVIGVVGIVPPPKCSGGAANEPHFKVE